MDTLRAELGITLPELEIGLFRELQKEFCDALAQALKAFDDRILALRDSDRYEVKEFLDRTLETLLGQINFKRRYYLDTETGKYVFLLDEVLGIPAEGQISPVLEEALVLQALTAPSYRAAEASIEQLYGNRIVSHETIRQMVKRAGKESERVERKRLKNPKGSLRFPVIFLEADALHVSLQNAEKRSVAEFSMTAHTGWQRRTPGSKDYSLKKIGQFRTQNGKDFWEQASRYLYSIAKIDEDTIVVINGDRASWIRKGVDYFPNAIYQVDRYHLKRDLKRLFGQDSRTLVSLFKALDSEDITGAIFLAELGKACKNLRDIEKKEACQRLINDLLEMPEATVDYRKRLQARGVSVEGFRGLGAGESQMAQFAARVKGKRSWSRQGLGAMMQLISLRNTGHIQQAINVVAKMTEPMAATSIKIAEMTEKAIRRVLPQGVYIPRTTVTPIAQTGRNRSGGMSHFIFRLNESGIPI